MGLYMMLEELWAMGFTPTMYTMLMMPWEKKDGQPPSLLEGLARRRQPPVTLTGTVFFRLQENLDYHGDGTIKAPLL